MDINWYPGHMAKSRRLMSDDLKKVDMVCEIIDARIPKSSRNTDLEKISEGKRRMIVLNRMDQADPAATKQWMQYFRSNKYTVIAADSKTGGFLNDFTAAAREGCIDLIKRNEEKGMVNKHIRLMIVGIPNVGKSTFINKLVGKKSAVAENRPGVTRKNQWFTLKGGFDFMDTPGMLWPNVEGAGYYLAFTGAIRDEVLDLEDVACALIKTLVLSAPGALEKRYSVSDIDSDNPYDSLEALARARGMLGSGGSADTLRMSRVLLDEYRSGKLGRITLEFPPEG